MDLADAFSRLGAADARGGDADADIDTARRRARLRFT
jgi:hypothetical protein